MMTWRTSLTCLVLLLLVLGGCDFSDFSMFDTPKVRPAEEKFTILLMTVRGANHVQYAKIWHEKTVASTGWKDTRVLNKEAHSLVFRGRYRTIEQAEGDLKQAKAFTTAQGLRPFQQAITYPLPGQHPGRPEWDITNAPQQFCYTVMRADFFNVTDPELSPRGAYLTRKEDAVALCEQMRTKGEQAFYHHGPTHSAVMVSLFDESAVQITRLPGGDTRPKVISPEVLAIEKRFPYLIVNGYEQWNVITDPVSGKKARQREKCRLITIPGRKADPKRQRSIPGAPAPWSPGADPPLLPRY